MFDKIKKGLEKDQKQEEEKPAGTDVKGYNEHKITGEPPKMRQILIHTDGNMATIIRADVAGSLELKAILIGLANNLK